MLQLANTHASYSRQALQTEPNGLFRLPHGNDIKVANKSLYNVIIYPYLRKINKTSMSTLQRAIAEHFGRKSSAIIVRMKKLGL